MKANQTATFNKELYLYEDGSISKLGKKKGKWNYFDLSGELVLEVEYDLLGKQKNKKLYPPKGIDKKAVCDFTNSEKFKWELKPLLDKYGNFKNGLYKLWTRVSEDDLVLNKDTLKDKNLDEICKIWQKTKWALCQEILYKDGKQIYFKQFNSDGILELEEVYNKKEYRKLKMKIHNISETQNSSKLMTQQHPKPSSVDDEAVRIDLTEDYFIWVKYAPKDKDDLENGLQKEWRPTYENQLLDTKIFKGKSSDEISKIWQDCTWCLKEIYYENGFCIWVKVYDSDGNVIDFVQNTPEREESEEELLKRLKSFISIDKKDIVLNYQEYLDLCIEFDEENKNRICIHKIMTDEELKNLENRLQINVPTQLLRLYRSFANGVDFEDGFELISSHKVLGIVDFFKSLQDDGFLNTDIFSQNCDEKFLDELNQNYFVFAQKKVDANFFIMLFRKDGRCFAINYSDDDLYEIYTRYLQTLPTSKSCNDLSIVWNNYLGYEKRNYYNFILEDLELYDECLEYEDLDIDRLFFKN